MSERKHQAWNFWSAFVFFGLVFVVGYLLELDGDDIREISFKEAVVIILASYRMTRILVFEKIFKYLRDVLKKREGLYVVGTLSSIITCPWCMGVWVTLSIIIFYYLVPYGALLVYVLALAGVASLVILFSNVMHMWTEGKQRIHQKSKKSNDMDSQFN
ncbi:MAG: hypothetical protein DRI98_05365 [Bacteroidetes bacterium]|nr:MAG: hypothetical protein DRI98_05365 [Bacteroidota bacterium]